MSDRSSSRSRSRSRSRSASTRSSKSRSSSVSAESRKNKKIAPKRVVNNKNKGGAVVGARLGLRNGSRNSHQITTPRSGGGGGDAAAKRVLSAGRIKMNELRNRITELSAQVVELQQENKLVRRMQHTHERKIKQYQAMDGDMPSLLHRQAEEAHMLREQLRRAKEKYEQKEKKLRDTEDDLDRTKRLLKKMKGLVEDKKLNERVDLSAKLEKVGTDLEEKEKTIKNLQRHIENLSKNHKHEFGIEHARHRDATRRAEELKAEIERLQAQLKEKEKELGMKNLYSQRPGQKPPHRISDSIRSSPVPPSDEVGLRQRGGPRITNGSDISGRVPHPEIEKKPAKSDKEWLPKGNDATTTAGKAKKSKQETVEEKRLAEMNRENLDRDKWKKAEEEAAKKEQERARHEKEKLERMERERVEEEREKADQEREKVERERQRIADEQAAAERIRYENSPEGREKKRQKEALLAKMQAIEKGDFTLDSQTSTTRSKQGKDDMSFGEYKPSFLTSTTTKPAVQNTNAAKKSNLINDLFSNGGGDGSDANKGKKDRSASPTLADFSFGGSAGGSGTSSKNGTRVLPKRSRVPVATMAHPGFGMVGNFDDDIEEFR